MNTDVTADSSTAAALPDIHTFTPKQLDTWRMTGKYPDAKGESAAEKDATEAVSSPAETTEAASSPAEKSSEAAKAAETSTASEAESKSAEPQRKRGNAQTRLVELLEENKRLKADLAKYAAPTTKADSSPQAAQSTAQGSAKPTPTDLKPDGTAKFATWEDYLEALADWRAEQRIKAYETERQKAERERREAEQRDSLMKDWRQRVQAAVQKYPDFEDTLAEASKAVPANSPLDVFAVNNKKYGIDVLHHLVNNPDELAEINSLPMGEAFERFIELGVQLTVSREPSEGKRITKALPPTNQVNTQSTAALDEVERARQSGDFEAYKRAMNRRDIARLKGR